MSKTSYIKSVDGLRFLAVGLVLADHWSGDMLIFPGSYLGVHLFFVLSGFLITRILLSAKEKDCEMNRGHGFSLKQFYLRRTICIFPLYYLFLIVLWAINFPSLSEYFVVLASYMTNNQIAFNAQWLGKVDHLWSLAVEEQYYLFFIGANWVVSYLLMPTSLGAFGFGGLLAYSQFHNKERLFNVFSSFSGLSLSLLIYVYLNSLSPSHNRYNTILFRLLESIFSVFLIGNLISPVGLYSNALNKLFAWESFVFIGKISYRIYIFHNFICNLYHESGDSYISKTLGKFQAVSRNIMEQWFSKSFSFSPSLLHLQVFHGLYLKNK